MCLAGKIDLRLEPGPAILESADWFAPASREAHRQGGDYQKAHRFRMGRPSIAANPGVRH
jgi:hypothetical protein